MINICILFSCSLISLAFNQEKKEFEQEKNGYSYEFAIYAGF